MPAVPVTGFAWNFSPMPLMAPPPLGVVGAGALIRNSSFAEDPGEPCAPPLTLGWGPSDGTCLPVEPPSAFDCGSLLERSSSRPSISAARNGVVDHQANVVDLVGVQQALVGDHA